MKLLSYLLVLTLISLSACEAGGGTQAQGSTVIETQAPNPTSNPVVITDSLPPISHIWVTDNIAYDDPHNPSQPNPQTPANQLLGSYLGGPTNGPIYTLNLSTLKDGINHNIEIPINQTHSCFYDIVLSVGFYNVNTLNACNDDTTGNLDTLHCNYCPYNNSGSYNNLNWIFDYSIANGHLTLTDSISGQVETYTIKN